MRCVTLFSAIALLIGVSTVLTQQAPAGVIEGIVLDAVSGQPVAGAQVALTSLPDGLLGYSPFFSAATPPPAAPPAPPVQVPPTTTSSDGKFSFKQLSAGNYRVAVTAGGYIRQEYGQRAVNGQGKVIYLTVGEAFTDATVRLIPTGTLTGRVFDENGQAAMGAPVQLIRAIYNVQGKNYQAVGGANADDRGQYRIYGVPPGRYILAAGNPPGPIRAVAPGGGGPSQQGAARFELLYYPNVQDLEQATPIEIKSSSEITMDMRLTRQVQTYTVRGRVIDATTGMPPANVSVSLGYRYLTSSGGFSSGQAYNAASGTFELRNVAPGNYTVQAQLQTPPPPPGTARDFSDTASIEAQRAAQASRPSAQVPVRVVNADVEGVVLTLKPSVTVGARVQLEGQQISSIASLDRLRVNLQPTIQNPGANPVSMPPQPDGTFQIVGLREAEYRVNVLMPAGNLYVKSVHYGGDDIYIKPFRFSGSGSGTVDIVLRSGTAQVSGIVTNAQSQPVSGIQTVAIPVQSERPDTIRVAFTDQSGRFNIPSLPPGDYRIFSWESIDNGAFYDPEFVKQYEQRGVLVHLAESASQTVDVKVIPAP